jgi:hypothetical protein
MPFTLTGLTTGTDILSLDLAGFHVIVLDTYQAAVDVLVKSGNDALQRSPLSFASMTPYELMALQV